MVEETSALCNGILAAIQQQQTQPIEPSDSKWHVVLDMFQALFMPCAHTNLYRLLPGQRIRIAVPSSTSSSSAETSHIDAIFASFVSRNDTSNGTNGGRIVHPPAIRVLVLDPTTSKLVPGKCTYPLASVDKVAPFLDECVAWRPNDAKSAETKSAGSSSSLPASSSSSSVSAGNKTAKPQGGTKRKADVRARVLSKFRKLR